MEKPKTKKRNNLLMLLLGCFLSTSQAATVTGTVDMIEVWENGNIAFRLNTSVSTCNGQFILNRSSAGTMSMYAALLSVKGNNQSVKVNYYDECGVAENYSNYQYNVPKYLYPYN